MGTKRIHKNEIVGNLSAMDVYLYLKDFHERGLKLERMNIMVCDEERMCAMSIVVNEDRSEPALSFAPRTTDDTLNKNLEDIITLFPKEP